LIDEFRNKNVLITGACGTVGRKLVRALLDLEVGQICAFDNDETNIFFLENEFSEEPRVHTELGDVRDLDRISRTMSDTHLVFHGAALKHVTVCERAPFEAVQTNVLGTQNIINAALSRNVERVIFMSSDKAVNPTSVMGSTKQMGERLITAANSLDSGSKTVFASIRFGNVIGSRGSVLPIFARQIKNGEDVTLTDERMTRFVMTSRHATTLVLRAAVLAHGGEVFITKMPVVRILDLARAVIDLLAPKCGHPAESIGMKTIGAKPGEKLYEELMSSEEIVRSLEIEDQFVVLPAFRDIYSNISYQYGCEISRNVAKPYRSDLEEAMTLDQIRAFLNEHRVFDEIEF